MTARHPSGPDEKTGFPLIDGDRALSTEQLATELKIPEATFDQWASRGGGPPYYILGKHRRYAPPDVRAWLKSRKRLTSSEPVQGAA